MAGLHVGGDSIVLVGGIGANAVVALPTLEGGGKAPWVVVQDDAVGGVWVRLGIATDVMTGVGQGIYVARNADYVALYTGAHTHIHLWDSTDTNLTITPLSQRPG